MLNETKEILTNRATNSLRGRSGWCQLAAMFIRRIEGRVWLEGYSRRRGENPPIALDLDVSTARALGRALLDAAEMEDDSG